MTVFFGVTGSKSTSRWAPSELSVLALTMGATAVLSALGMISAYLKFEVMGGRSTLFTSAFMLSYEGNVPTLFSYTLINFCCVLLLLIAVREWDRRSDWCAHWIMLGIVFYLLAFDEAASVHEKLIPLFQAHGASGLLYFSWVIPAGIFVSMMAVLYLRWLLSMPGEIRRLMIFSALIYVGGALLVEMPEGAYAETHGQNTFLFHLLTVVEETFEMMGLSLFSYALLRYSRYLNSRSMG